VCDLVAAATLLLLLSPLFLLLVLLVWRNLGRPIFFREPRGGRGGRPFTFIKFRSMLNTRDEQGRLLPDEERLTRFGRWLRRTSLDELPQLFNVLRGEMSLIGPRPLTVRYLPRYSSRQARRHEVRPGITGWAQVNGRNAVDWPQRFEMDVWYVENLSLWLDLKIAARTLLAAVTGRGVSPSGSATMPEFLGQDETPLGTAHN